MARLKAVGELSSFLKGCVWSPDGLCVLTATDDEQLLLFNTPHSVFVPPQVAQQASVESPSTEPTGAVEARVASCEIPRDSTVTVGGDHAGTGLTATSTDSATAAAGSASTDRTQLEGLRPVLTVQEGEMVYDYCWFPGMNSYDPTTCCFLSTTRDHPLHLWDAFTGALRCTYRPYDHLDEIAAAYSIAFTPDGSRIFAGFKDAVRVFDVCRPGRQCTHRKTAGRKGDGQRGIVSCIAFAAADPATYACGSYSKTVGVYDDRTKEPWAVLEAESGVTQVMFSPDGTLLYTACRQASDILCWDIRNTVEVVARFGRQATTNQRVKFDLTPNGATLVAGSQDGTVLLYDARHDAGNAEPYAVFKAHEDSANGVSVHPSLPLLATASGQRKFAAPMLSDADSSDDSSSDEEQHTVENTLKLWSLDHAR